VVSVAILAVTGYAWVQYRSLDAGLHRSGALAGNAGSQHGDTNILIMGLDSRLDENGDPLPAAIYDALHAGDSSSGGENANVLMLVHVPGDGSRATSISIPRDDYVDIPGCPDGQCKGKIKQAYGLAFDAASKQLAAQPGLAHAQKIQLQRDAGRKAEISTVRQLLGGVPIDHFVEVTLVAFFQIAQVVQPITVCLDENTQDSYSGADFHAGRQQINAQQAVAFVRQRRDYVHPQLNFTDLDRERRQQAFIASLAYQLKQGGTLTDPAQLQGILDVAKQNIAVDSGLDLLSFAQQASNLTGGNVTFVTLPVDHFGKDPAGEDVNIVDVPAIQAQVHQLIGGGTTPPTPPPAQGSPTGVTVDVLNATGRPGLAAELEKALTAIGYTAGSTGNDDRHLTHTVVDYAPGQQAAAGTLAGRVGSTHVVADPTLPAGHLRVVEGTDLTMPSAAPTSAAVPRAASAAPGPASSPPALNPLAGGGIPCVK
jgi:LCP family protein required for cell wall assembly